jgi:hypothetical protein
MNRKKLYITKYLTIFEKCLDNQIKDTEYIREMQELCEKGFKTYHIENFHTYVNKFITKNLINAYNISILINLRDIKYKYFVDVSNAFARCKKIMYTNGKNMIVRINSIQKFCKKMLRMIRSFKKLDTQFVEPIYNNIDMIKYCYHDMNSDNKTIDINSDDSEDSYNSDDYDSISLKREYMKLLSDEPDLLELNTIDSSECNISPIIIKIHKDEKSQYNARDTWGYNFRRDILDRLHLLVRTHYTIDQLVFMGVKLKYLSELQSINVDDLRCYYIDTVAIIHIFFSKLLKTCLEYINIEMNYINCCKQINCDQLSVLTPIVSKLCYLYV